MEAKLKEYRAKKRRQEQFENIKKRFLNTVSFMDTSRRENADKSTVVTIPPLNEIENLRTKLIDQEEEDAESSSSLQGFSTDEDARPKKPNEIEKNGKMQIDTENKWLKYTLRVVWFLFWATCYAIAIELQFGVVYLMLSGLFGIYFNTRTDRKKKNEISAYSVFNKNCYSIDGTLKAEQFDKEIRHGFNSVK